MIKKKQVKTIISFLLFTALIFQTLFYPSRVKADEIVTALADNNSQVISKAMEWLSSKQEGEGYWGNSELINDTCEVLQVYSYVGSEKGVTSAYSWLEGKNYCTDHDSMARYISINPKKNINICEELIKLQNSDGGFGLTSNYASDVLDSLLVLEALEDTGATYKNVVIGIISYLLSVQNEDGGFGYNSKSGSDIALTARVADSINNYFYNNFFQSEAVTNALAKVNTYLTAVSYYDFTAENFEQSIYTYEYVYDSLSLENTTEFVNKLSQAQSADGSFLGDIHDTCLAVKLLKKIENRNALGTEVKGLVLSSDITSLYTNCKTKVNITADISYFTNYDKTYTLETKVYDGDAVKESNSNTVLLSRNNNKVKVGAISTEIMESTEKVIVVKSVIYDELGNAVTKDSLVITVKDKLIETDVLLIQSVLPWSSNANEIVLKQLGVTYDKLTAEQALNVDLLDYRLIIVANDQTNSVYRAIAQLKIELESFANNGGTLLYGVCDGGWSSGTSDVYIPGNLEIVRYYNNNNYIADAEHPIVTALYSNKIPLVNSDLISNYCSHTYIKPASLPQNANIILNAGENYPTLVEYHIGKGLTIASCLTWEHGYSFGRNFAIKALDDLFLYALNAAYDAIDDKPGTVTSTLTTDKSSYHTGETVKIHIKNELSSFRRQVNGVISITDRNDNLVEKIYTDLNEAMTVGIPVERDYTWTVKNILADSYKVKIDWFDNGERVGGGDVVFKVISDKQLSNNVGVNSEEVTADTDIVITDTISNQSTNSVENNLDVVFKVYHRDGRMVAEYKNNIAQMLQGTKKVITETVDLLDWEVGEYKVISTVSKEGEVQSSSTVSFKIIEADKTELSLSGNIEVSDSGEDEIKNLIYSVTNNGKKAVNNLNVNVTFYDVLTNTEVCTVTKAAISLNANAIPVVSGSAISLTNATAEFNDVFDTSVLEPGDYVAVLSANFEGQDKIVLDADYFTVEDRIPPYFLTGYSLFSGSSDITIDFSQAIIQTPVFSNNNFIFNGSILKILASCSTVNKINLFGCILDILEKVENTGNIVLPDFTQKLLKNMSKEQGLVTTDKVVYDSDCEIIQPTICNQAEFKCTNTRIYKNLVSENNVILNCNQVTVGNEVQTVVCSLNGDIVINSSTVDIKGLIYAPNGTVYINSSSCNIIGTIIAKEIRLQGSCLNINPLVLY